jgi:hypothetical protein
MASSREIHFFEISATATDFLHELSDPSLLRNRRVPPLAAVELRRQQVEKLRQNIAVLTAKREEFNRKMTDYIGNLEKLVSCLEKRIARDLEGVHAAAAHAPGHGTSVRCLTCRTERLFRDLEIIFARESDESLSLPTEVYVLDEGVLKKGHFACKACGTGSLVIRAAPG